MKAMRLILGGLMLVGGLGFSGQSALAADDEMSVSEMKSKAQSIIAELRGLRDKGESSLRQAKADKNMDRMDCVNEALIALKGVLKLGEDYGYDLEAAVTEGDGAAVKANFKKLSIAKKKVEDLDARVRSCGGPDDEGVVEGKPNIERLFDTDLPDQDPIQGLESDSMFVSKPNSISPYN